MNRKPKSRSVTYTDRDTFERRDGEVLDRNGALTYVEDRETGRADWYDRFELERRD